MSESKLFSAFEQHNQVLEQSLALGAGTLDQLAATLAEVFAQEHRLLVVGSGTLSPIAGLVAQAFVHQLNMERPSLPAVAVTAEAGLASALLAADDYARLYSCQLQSLAQAGDQLLILDATSDAAVLNAAQTAKELGCAVTVISCGDVELWQKEGVEALIPLLDAPPARAVEAVLFLGHVLCELVEAELFGF